MTVDDRVESHRHGGVVVIVLSRVIKRLTEQLARAAETRSAAQAVSG